MGWDFNPTLFLKVVKSVEEKEMLIRILSNQRIIIEQINSIVEYISERDDIALIEGQEILERGDV